MLSAGLRNTASPSSAATSARVRPSSSATRSRSTWPTSCSVTASASAAVTIKGEAGGWITRSLKIGPGLAVPLSSS